MFGLSIRIFRVFGIDIKIDLGWALIAMFIAWSLAQGVFPQLYEGFSAGAYWQLAIVAIVGLSASIIIHELAHSLVAKAMGLPLKSITLFAFGGVAELEAEPKSPLGEFTMAIVGPITSAALAVLFGYLSSAAEGLGVFPPLASVLDYLSLINWMLAIFNMLPALPLDGGRAFRAVIWSIKGDFSQATRIAAASGVAVGTAIMALGVVAALFGQFTGGLWWVLIGFFIRMAARGSVLQEHMMRLFRGAPVRDFMTRDPARLDPGDTLREFVDDYVYKKHFDLYPVTQDSRVVGAMGLAEAKSVATDKWDRVRVGDVMAPATEANTIEASADAMDALMKMNKEKRSRLIVVEDGRLAGMLALKDLLDLLNLKFMLEGR